MALAMISFPFLFTSMLSVCDHFKFHKQILYNFYESLLITSNYKFSVTIFPSKNFWFYLLLFFIYIYIEKLRKIVFFHHKLYIRLLLYIYIYINIYTSSYWSVVELYMLGRTGHGPPSFLKFSLKSLIKLQL